MTIKFSTKAETLAALEGRLVGARVLPQIRFTLAEWRAAGKNVARVLGTKKGRPDWLSGPVIVRSSGRGEDTETQSLAGHFLSVLNVQGDEKIGEAVEAVSKSLGRSGADQIFVQPMLLNVKAAGVMFTRDAATGGHYFVVNMDRQSGATDAVTSGVSNEIDTHYIFRTVRVADAGLNELIELAAELEALFLSDALDFEFAFASDGLLYLLQVRPLILGDEVSNVGIDQAQAALTHVTKRMRELARPHPYLLGRQATFGNMTDWNPAEMIGARPRALSLSLYKELLTDNIWAYQRDNYGYRNLRSFPLLIDFAGMPYIDVRVSFNSFIPASLDEQLADRLVNHYLAALSRNVALHDKVEFDIIYSCYTLDLPERISDLQDAGFTPEEQREISESLRDLTNRIVHDEMGLWHQDSEKIGELEKRQAIIAESDLGTLEKIYWLIEDCKRYGTLPFAGLARAGFIAIQFLRSMVAKDILSESDYEGFMETLTTVGSDLGRDFQMLNREKFLSKYGHLRPGTYDILSPRYDEAPERYFDWSGRKDRQTIERPARFGLALDKMNRLEALLREHRLEHNVLTLLNFIKGAIEGREYAKFAFTRSVSDVLRLLRSYGEDLGFSAEDMSYANIECVKTLYASSCDPYRVLARSIKEGREAHAVTKSLIMPPVIADPQDVMAFQMPRLQPNFVTLKVASGPVRQENARNDELGGAIMMIASADPGYDWIFAHGIAGLITKYGGVNSHMAIRAGELGIPAVIGAGDANFERWRIAEALELDGSARQVRVIR